MILLSETCVSAVPVRTVGNLDIRMQRLVACPLVSNLPRACSRYPQVSPLVTARHISLTERDKQVLAELRQACSMALLRGHWVRHGLGRKPRKSHERAPVVASPVPLPLSPALGRGPQKVLRETRN